MNRNTARVLSCFALALAMASCNSDDSDDAPKAESVVIDFDTITLPESGVRKGSEGELPISISGVTFALSWDTAYGGLWSGIAASNHTDVTTAGYTNQFSTFAGQGADGSEQFAIVNGEAKPITFDTLTKVLSVDVSNTTYAALSMTEGDAFAKKFTAEDEDFFVVMFIGYDVAGDSVSVVEHYLADFRAASNKGIQSDWVTVDLEGLGMVKEIGLSFNSSDIGNYGMNTPAYVAIDNFTFEK